MYKIEFYSKNGKSQVYEFLEDLRKKKDKNKDARIQYSQAASYIQLLSDNGTNGLPKSIVEHLSEGIWELRPGNNRIFFFFFTEEGHYVLLHQFRKKTQKTPVGELRKAKTEREDYLAQKSKEMGKKR